MKVEQFYSDESMPQNTLRILDTTCPKCRQHVQSALQEDDFILEENEFLRHVNEKAGAEIKRLNVIIDCLLTRPM